MAYFCFKCSAELQIEHASRITRREECPSCTTSLHCCRNCRFYDQTAYNDCLENQAERTTDKDNANFCDYFEFKNSLEKPSASNPTENAIKKLDDLFK